MDADKLPDDDNVGAGEPDPSWSPAQREAYERHRIQRSSQRMALGRRILELRQKKRWSQSELARASGLKKNVINTTERGLSQPRLENLAAIAEALGAKVTDLTGMYDEDGAKSQAHPTVSAVEMPGNPKAVWLTINRPVSLGTAAKIYALLDEDHTHDAPSAAHRG
ncbi:helix-turn-helix domain-containing protein [Methylorubrum zatmanii]